MDNIWNAVEAERRKHPDAINHNLADVWASMSDQQLKFVNDFICDNTRMSYEETTLWDLIGEDIYQTRSYFKFTCRSMPWANNKIRVQYYGGVGERFYGRMWDDKNISQKVKGEDQYYKQPNWNIEGVNITDIEEFWLKRESFTKSGYKFEHNEILNGM